jgi:hypothetical protein
MTAEHERAYLLRKLAPVELPWRTHGLLLRAVLLVLTLAGCGIGALLLDAFDIPRPGAFMGIAALIGGEALIRVRRWWWTGVEEALWIAGTFGLISALPSSGTPESMLVLALGAAIPGWRVRNPLFGALAAIFVAQYCEKRFDLGVVAAMVIAAIAVVALLRTWRRPSTEWLWIAIAIVMPVAGRVDADAVWRDVTIAIYAAFALGTLFLAITKRHHALFVTGAIALVIATGDASEKLDIAAEGKLSIAGALLLVGSWLVSRALRDNTAGFVTTPAKLTPIDDEIELAATIAIPTQTFDQKMESGGRFGGAGATGDY